MSSISSRVNIAMLVGLAAAVVLIQASTAPAATLNGLWAPATRCPVDDPIVLGADGVNSDATCVAANSPSGSIKLGSTTATTGNTNLQLGAALTGGTDDPLASPSGGALVSNPVEVPGGLLGLMCPSDVPVVSALCHLATDNDLNRVTATVQPAGEPSSFSTAAGLSLGQPIVTLPVKVRLQNALLDPNCSIGSDSDPIVLRPRNTTTPSASIATGALDGTPNASGPLISITVRSTQGDDSFAVPGASGCGLLGLADAAINLRQGLPSPSGNNELVLNDASSSVISAHGVTGEEFSAGWHSAVLP